MTSAIRWTVRGVAIAVYFTLLITFTGLILSAAANPHLAAPVVIALWLGSVMGLTLLGGLSR